MAELDFHAARGERELKALSPRVARLLPLARTAYDYEFIARYSLAAGRRAAAKKYSTRAIETDSSCVACFATAAEVAFADGKQKLAIQLQKRAINMLPHGASAKRLSNRLAVMHGGKCVPTERSDPAAQ